MKYLLYIFIIFQEIMERVETSAETLISTQTNAFPIIKRSLKDIDEITSHLIPVVSLLGKMKISIATFVIFILFSATKMLLEVAFESGASVGLSAGVAADYGTIYGAVAVYFTVYCVVVAAVTAATAETAAVSVAVAYFCITAFAVVAGLIVAAIAGSARSTIDAADVTSVDCVIVAAAVATVAYATTAAAVYFTIDSVVASIVVVLSVSAISGAARSTFVAVVLDGFNVSFIAAIDALSTFCLAAPIAVAIAAVAGIDDAAASGAVAATVTGFDLLETIIDALSFQEDEESKNEIAAADKIQELERHVQIFDQVLANFDAACKRAEKRYGYISETGREIRKPLKHTIQTCREIHAHTEQLRQIIKGNTKFGMKSLVVIQLQLISSVMKAKLRTIEKCFKRNKQQYLKV